MTLERSFRLSSLFMTISGFTGLILAAPIPLFLTILGWLALTMQLIHVLGWGLDRITKMISEVSTAFWNSLMIVAFFACVIDLAWISQDVLLAGINFLIVVMVNKLFHLKERKDFLYLYAISFLLLLAAAALTVEPWYAFVFVAFLLSSIWTLLLYHLRNEVEEHQQQSPDHVASADFSLTAKFFWSTNGIALAALVITAGIFFVTPRTGAGFFQNDRGQTIHTSGFSQSVNLGVIGTIKLDPTVVMRVEIPGTQDKSQDPMYLQGAIFDRYDGKTWSNSFHAKQPVGRYRAGEFLVSRESQVSRSFPHYRQEILMEALDSTVLFGMPTIQSVKGDFLILQRDPMGGLHLPFSPTRQFQYSVESAIRSVVPEDRKIFSLDHPPFITKHFLQLPVLSPRIEALARSVTHDSQTILEKVNSIKWHLMGKYRYSLDVGPGLPENPVEEFLFDRKTGYCEHYATAMVVMLRSIGIPSRLVTGFLPTEWNDFGNYFTVRQQDAHAWVEVYFPKSGWVTFDPTPPGSAVVTTSAVALFSRWLDSLRMKWNRVVIQYSFRDQQTILEEIRSQSAPVRSHAWGSVTKVLKWTRNWKAWLASRVQTLNWQHALLWIVGFLAGAGLVRWWWTRRRWTLPSRQPVNPVQSGAMKLYGQMLHTLEAHGFPKAPSSGPLEFAGHLSGQWPPLTPYVRPLTDLYCRGRFGLITPDPEELLKAKQLLHELSRELHHREKEDSQ